MSIDLTWTASFSASCLHVADALLRGRTLADPSLQTALDRPSHTLAAEIDALGLPREETLAQLTELAAERAIVKTVGNSHASSGAIERLAVRGEPLRQQREARGPGLLSAVGRLTEENLIVSTARVGRCRCGATTHQLGAARSRADPPRSATARDAAARLVALTIESGSAHL